MIKLIQPYLKEGIVLFSDLPGHQAPHGGTIPPHILVTALKPDNSLFNQLSEEVIVFYLICPWDSNIARSHAYECEKYSSLIAYLSQSYVVSFFSVFPFFRLHVARLIKKSFLFKCCTGTGRDVPKPLIRVSSKAALLSSYSIFPARREPTWENPAPLTVR